MENNLNLILKNVRSLRKNYKLYIYMRTLVLESLDYLICEIRNKLHL